MLYMYIPCIMSPCTPRSIYLHICAHVWMYVCRIMCRVCVCTCMNIQTYICMSTCVFMHTHVYRLLHTPRNTKGGSPCAWHCQSVSRWPCQCPEVLILPVLVPSGIQLWCPAQSLCSGKVIPSTWVSQNLPLLPSLLSGRQARGCSQLGDVLRSPSGWQWPCLPCPAKGIWCSPLHSSDCSWQNTSGCSCRGSCHFYLGF